MTEKPKFHRGQTVYIWHCAEAGTHVDEYENRLEVVKLVISCIRYNRREKCFEYFIPGWPGEWRESQLSATPEPRENWKGIAQ